MPTEAENEIQLQASLVSDIRFYVAKTHCSHCLFTPARIVSGRRMKQIIKSCLANDTHFQCHKGTLVGRNICCRGFYDAYQHDVLVIRLAKWLGIIEEVDVEQVESTQ